MPIVNVASNVPSQVASSAADAFLVRNVGANTVYLADNQALTTGSYDMSLAAGASLNWAGKRELWAICQNGQTSSMEVIYGGATAISPSPPVTVANGNTISILPNLAFKALLPVQTISGGVNSYTSPAIDASGIAFLMIIFNSNDIEGGGGLQVTAGIDTVGINVQDVHNNAFANPQAVAYRYFGLTRWIVAPPSDLIQIHLSTTTNFGAGNNTISVYGTDKAIGEGFVSYGPVQGGYSMFGYQTSLGGYPNYGSMHWDIGFGVPGPVAAGNLVRLALPISRGAFQVLDETIVQNGAGTVMRRFCSRASSATPQPYTIREDDYSAAGTYKNQGLILPIGRHPLYLELLGTGTSFTYSGNFYIGEMFK